MKETMAVLTALGIAGVTGSVLLGAAAGAVVAVCISDAPLTARIATGIAGFALAAAGTQPLTQWLELGRAVDAGVALLLALFGVPVVLEARAVFADGTVRALIKGFLNRKGGGQ